MAISCLAGAWLCGDARQLAADPEPASVLLAVTELVTAALLARCGLGALLALVTVALKGPASTCRAALRITPGLLRPALSGLLTLSVSTAVAAPALAAERPPGLPTAAWSTSEGPGQPPHDGTTPSAMSLPAPGWVPAAPRPVRAPTPGRLLTGVPLRDPAPPGVVVHRGDTLWSIVARALGPRA
ncbi:MAG TPA: hypothetical protein VHO27_07525, partial [Angustibacter sp.]|nr:hypothetical protein [Angustibacter sp.]